MANNNCEIIDLSENAEHLFVKHPVHLNKYQRSLTYPSVLFVKRQRFGSDPALEFLPLDDIIGQTNETPSHEHSSSDHTFPAQHSEVKITPEEETTASPTKKMSPIKAWCRRTIPDYITCHQVWLVVHAIVTIPLCVLYFTRVIQISAGSVAICELLFGVLVRNEIFIALLHRLVAFIPYFKYEFNRMLHCIGGVHVSCAVVAFFWLLISLSCEHHGLGVRITGGFILFLIISLSLTAMPRIRRRLHNTFEFVHRYVGWTSLIILVIHVVFLQVDKFQSFTTAALFNLPVLILIVIVIIIFLPWICVRKVFVQFKQPSKNLTIITFPRALYPYGSTTRISLNGREWHAFAIALTDSYTDQHSIVVAAVGDWTKALAENYRTNQLPEHLWIRRIKGLGFMYSIHAYRKVLIVCTGAGIAPALPYIKDPLPTTHIHLLWIGKQHQDNYGEYIWELVQKRYPHFTLHDTALSGRPGPQFIEDHFWKSESEAVFVVSNQKFTVEVTNALWRKSIPCFGALFDS